MPECGFKPDNSLSSDRGDDPSVRRIEAFSENECPGVVIMVIIFYKHGDHPPKKSPEQQTPNGSSEMTNDNGSK